MLVLCDLDFPAIRVVSKINLSLVLLSSKYFVTAAHNEQNYTYSFRCFFPRIVEGTALFGTFWHLLSAHWEPAVKLV